jgi:uncharacterized membrane protein YheB (UPF0754 family)
MKGWLLLIIPVTSACIGWASIRLFIKMLFHPQKPLHILGITIQGIFPKKQPQFARKLGALVSNELFSFTDLEAKVTSPDNFKKIMPMVEIHVDDFLRNKLKEAFPMIGMLIGDRTISTLKTIFMNELESLFPVIMKGYMQNLQQELDLEQMISSKIAALSSAKLEAALYQELSKELRLAGLVGAIIGLLTGFVQVAIIMAFA